MATPKSPAHSKSAHSHRAADRQGTHATAEAKANRKGSDNRCWRGFVPVAGKRPGAKGSCRKAAPGVNHRKRSPD